MEEKNVLIWAVAVLILAAGGFLAANSLFMNETSTLPAVSQKASTSACESALDGQLQIMEQGDTREIPASCFQNGEPVTDRISGAEPGDSFRKTESGIKVAE
ncbi:MAG: hypothetical protein ABEJ36_00745 [Candidatus Nanosalina sp.]